MLATFMKKMNEAQWQIRRPYEIQLCLFVVCLATLLVVVISSFRREVDENCTLVGYYPASSGNSLLKFRDNL